MISKPARLSQTNTTIINHTNTSSFLETDIKTRISKTDISDHFRVFLISMTTRTDKQSALTSTKRQNISSEALQDFK